MKKNLRILVIDDNPDITESLSLWLEIEGYSVKIAENGSEGISAVESFFPDIILLDIGLPYIDGYQVAEKLRQQIEYKNLIIAMSGYSNASDLNDSVFDYYLTKPPMPGKLIKLFQSYQRSRENY